MKRLFHANLVRLLRDRVFWLSNGILLIYTVVYMLNACRQERSGLKIIIFNLQYLLVYLLPYLPRSI